MRVLAVLTAALLITVPALLHGIWGGRWSRSRELEQAVARLEGVPVRIGDWEGRDRNLGRRQLEAAELDACLVRRYENRRDGRVIDMLLMCGRPGPVCVHTPDVCVPSSGLDLMGRPARCSFGGGEFWSARFQKDDAAVPVCRRILWAWSTGGGWTVPDSPRFTFARFRALYKLYLIQELAGEEQTEEDCEDFIRLLLPELEKALSAAG